MIAVLLSWASHLTGDPYPNTVPEIRYEPQEFFAEHACPEPRNCRAVAWYDNQGTIFLHEELKDLEDPMIRSVVVHELVHYLQDINGRYPQPTCADQAAREREAYAYQRMYLNRIAGRFAATYPVYDPCPLGDAGQ